MALAMGVHGMDPEPVNETVTTDKMVDDNEEEKVDEAATDRSGIDIIGLTNIDTAEVLPLKEQWWSAAPAAPLEPLSPEQLLALVANDNDDINVAAGTAGKVDNIDPSTPPVIRASINTLLSHPYDMEAWARLVDECKASKWRRREILYASTRQFPTSGKNFILWCIYKCFIIYYIIIIIIIIITMYYYYYVLSMVHVIWPCVYS
jgi:hypothetical protein